MKRTAHISSHVMPVRSDLHLIRKAWHMFMGLLMVYVYYSGLASSTAVLILGSVLAFAILVEMARLQLPSFNDKVLLMLAPIMRSHEVNRMSTVPHYLLASILAIAIFPKPVAVLSILYLACGDPIASLFGILYGNRSIRFSNGKSLIGTLAGVVTCALVTVVFLGATQSLPVETLLALTVIGGIAGGTAELLPVDVDDNFVIPVVSGFVLWLAFIALGL